jgi:hypothetical protein
MMALLTLGSGHPERSTDTGRARKPTLFRRLALAIHDLHPARPLAAAAGKVAYRLVKAVSSET